MSIDLDQLILKLNVKFALYWWPDEYIVIDESMIGTHTRCPFIVIIPRKSDPKGSMKGVKFWTLCDWKYYCYHLSMYKRSYEKTSDTIQKMLDSFI